MDRANATTRQIDWALSAAIERSRAHLDPWMVGAGAAATLVAGYAMAELDRAGLSATPSAILERARAALSAWSTSSRAAA